MHRVLVRSALALGLVAGLLVLPAGAAAQDCVGPGPDAEPGTAMWEQREAANVACGHRRESAFAANPPYQAALAAQAAGPEARRLQDPLRAVGLHAGRRFHHDRLTFTGHEGAVRPAEVFRPCDATCAGRPPELAEHRTPTRRW